MFLNRSEEEGEDEVDSDFSIEENDEPVSDQDDDEPKKKRRLVTKAYKEPVVVLQKIEKPVEVKRRKPRKKSISADNFERKSIRRSTAAKSAATLQRLKERTEEGRRRKGRRARAQDEWRPTQEELLEEAKITEQENLKSLEKYQKLEMEKKKTRTVKKAFQGPIIRYHSMCMPLIEVIHQEQHESPITVDEGDDDREKQGPTDVTEETTENSNERKSEVEIGEVTKKEEKNREVGSTINDSRCERTFITFLDDQVFWNVFPQTQAKPPTRSICPITRLQARYFDPVTQLPYSNLQAFRILREAYYQQLEGRGDRNNPDVARWIEWRQKMKELKSAIVQQISKSIHLEPATLPVTSQ
ncbi:putative vacuolar protein sorting-associated protein 72 [Cryptotermes secundus]|uniref:Vacuolar protein sorting-associated protein 72 homolog n=1 Tax=Cryptotermes secundus TaxID=105785 RepID=A0A2J7RE90_9NEOP|nr:putative vacuolar protein sorting-associated protein 72 [Cryptotermes secundus]